jgi:transcription-repair coupling factor (superfamily II helicase)
VSLPTLIAAIEDLPELDAVVRAIPSRAGLLSVSGLHGSSDALLVAAMAKRIPTRLILIVSDDVADAERWLADLSQLVESDTEGMLPVAFYPPRESFGEAELHAEIAGERVETLERMARGAVRIVITTSRAILERTQLPGALESSRLEIRKGDTRRPESLAEHLESIGFERVPMVEDVAQFSVRGGIFDIYGFGMAEPVRLEFFGDDITELRHFDLVTQRSTRDADVALILPVDGSVTSAGDKEESERSSIRALLPPDTLLVVPQGTHIAPEVERTWSEAEHHIDLARRRGENTPYR